jgi:hypothetical protein
MGEIEGPCACRATFSHFIPQANFLPSRLFPEIVVQRKGLKEMTRLAWAQEAPGSNPGAPTKSIFRIFFSLKNTFFTQNLTVEIRQAGGLDL